MSEQNQIEEHDNNICDQFDTMLCDIFLTLDDKNYQQTQQVDFIINRFDVSQF